MHATLPSRIKPLISRFLLFFNLFFWANILQSLFRLFSFFLFPLLVRFHLFSKPWHFCFFCRIPSHILSIYNHAHIILKRRSDGANDVLSILHRLHCPASPTLLFATQPNLCTEIKTPVKAWHTATKTHAAYYASSCGGLHFYRRQRFLNTQTIHPADPAGPRARPLHSQQLCRLSSDTILLREPCLLVGV